jgi:ankyrin repeat protein
MQSLITEDEMFQTELNQLLVFSIANGFVGLQNVPIQSVLKYLSRHGGINSLLLQFLQASKSHVSKALAENLFRAAIEAKDELALKRLLAIGSVDVNTTICIVNDRKYTPVERAASLQHLGIVELLLSARADVNKTCHPDPSRGGALAVIVNWVDLNTRPTPECVELSSVLLQAGAIVRPHILMGALRSFHYHELAYRLVSNVSDSDHSNFFNDGCLEMIAAQFDDWHATEAIKKIILACERTKCQRCLTHFENKVDMALVIGARRGHLKLVQLLLRHSKTPHRALSAAIRSGRDDVIDVVLTLKPDIDAPADNISHETFTTPLAEAIAAGDERLIHMIEDAGSLEHLNEGGRLEPAIAAASKTGNLVYVRKLLDHCQSPDPLQMARAVLYAVQNDHEEIFQALLAAGADVNFEEQGRSGPPTPLLAAMCRRNHRMVREILNSDVAAYSWTLPYLYKSRMSSVFEEAIKWGDRSIFHDLRFTFPDAVLGYEELSQALKENVAWFECLLKSGIASRSGVTKCLEIALSRGDAELFHSLIEGGADPTDQEILNKCAIEHPKMLPLLLKQISFRISPHKVSGFGTAALNAAIKQGPIGFEVVQVLLDSGLVDSKSFSESYSNRRQSPLGLAIRVSREGNHAGFKVIRKLLDAGCDPNSVVTMHSYTGFHLKQTALVEAIETGSKDLVQLMISRGATVRTETTMGLKRSPLQKAVEVDSFEIVTLLLEAGADVNTRPATRGGRTALQSAAIRGNCNMAIKLLAHGADLQALPAEINGRWPLEGAAEHGRLEMIEFLWKRTIAGFDQEQCQRAMELAEGNGHMACKNLIAELSRASMESVPAVSHSVDTFGTVLDLM